MGESVRASESLDDVPHRLRLPSYPPVGPTDRLPDLYGSLSTLLGINQARGSDGPWREACYEAWKMPALEPYSVYNSKR